jgi:hypothetical protein
MLTRDEYVAKMKTRLDKWSAEMDVLEAKAHKTQEEAKVKYQEQLVAHCEPNGWKARKSWRRLKSATEDSWEDLKAETENVWEAFKDSVHAFKLHFK